MGKKSHRRSEKSSDGNRFDPYILASLYNDACEWLAKPENRDAEGHPNYNGATALFPGIKYDTLRRRFLGETKPAQYAHGKQMLMSIAEEEALVDWMVKDATEGKPWSLAQLLRTAKSLCKMDKEPSPEWAHAFSRRHSTSVRFRGTSGLDPKRARCFNPTTVKQHLTLFGQLSPQYRVKINLDEMGRQIAGGRKRSNRKFFTEANDKMKYKYADDNLELVTVLECACDDGTMLDPGFIFRGKQIATLEWFEGQENRTISVGLTSNGWTNDDQCCLWFEKVFVPQARAKALDDDEHILLIFDGHHSHLTDKLMELGLKYKIDFYVLPPHTTHKLQPLDVGIFGLPTQEFRSRCTEVLETLGRPMTKEEFVKEYLKIRDKCVTTTVVLAAWKKTGLSPYNPDVFTDADFAPSRPFSTRAHFPSSFPSTSDTTRQLESVDTPTPPPLPIEIPPQPQPNDSPRVTTPSPQSDGPTCIPDIATNDNQFLPPSACPRGEKMPSFVRTPISDSETVTRRAEILAADLARLEAKYVAEFEARQRAETHCRHAALVIQNLQARVNDREHRNAAKSKKYNTSAVFLMGPEAQAEAAERRVVREQKELDDAERKRVKDAQEALDRLRRAQLSSGEAVEFSGNLRYLKKQKLQDIAHLLGLPIGGTNEELGKLIRSELTKHPSYREDPRFSRLYTRIEVPATQPDSEPEASTSAHTLDPPSTMPNNPRVNEQSMNLIGADVPWEQIVFHSIPQPLPTTPHGIQNHPPPGQPQYPNHQLQPPFPPPLFRNPLSPRQDVVYFPVDNIPGPLDR